MSDAVWSQGGAGGGLDGSPGAGLRLEVLDFDGPSRWRWRLTDAGVFLADHRVELDPASWQFEAFDDVYGFLQRNVTSDRVGS